MSWSTGTIGAAAGLPGAAATEVDPAWQPWLDLLEVALEEPERAWDSTVTLHADRLAGAPLLHGAVLRLDSERAGNLLRRLASEAGISAGGHIDARDAIRAAVTRDDRALAEIAERCGAPIDSLALLAQVAAMPLLRAASRQLPAGAEGAWQRGYCPVCGAWPSLVEIRGIERERRLRCGSCSADWSLPLLRCAFCDEADHEKLGSLHPEGEEHLRHVETCESCHGYLKAATTFAALPIRTLMLVDVATIPLDLVAHDRGYARPARPGWAPNVDIVS
ncbi:MAG TPA: formate dehydrogenase accessory protein FdhE [Gemmatimonadaceae bacterium]